jgi:pentatricopeptide repeat protein
MGSAYLAAGKFDKALELFHKSIDKGSRVIDPNDGSYDDLKDHPEFIRLLERLSNNSQPADTLQQQVSA